MTPKEFKLKFRYTSREQSGYMLGWYCTNCNWNDRNQGKFLKNIRCCNPKLGKEMRVAWYGICNQHRSTSFDMNYYKSKIESGKQIRDGASVKECDYGGNNEKHD